MLQSAILQKFIRNRLKDKLYLFFDLEHCIIEGLTIRNLGIKPDLLKQLSQIIKVPLILTSGSIGSVSLNIPWESLFTTKKDQAVAVVISDIKISAKLPIDFQKQYITLRKKKIIEKFTQQFNQKSTSRLAFFNKLKEYFFGTFCIEVKNMDLQISIQMKHSLIAQLRVNYLKFQKDIKTNRTKFEINHLSLGYRLAKQNKTQYIINQADLQLTGEKTNEVDADHLETNNIFISFTNQNFNDVIRIVTLVKWHNSFIDIPCELWPVKPTIIGEVSAKKKLIYVVNIIKYRILQNNRSKNWKKILEQRSKYLKAFQSVRRDPNDKNKKQLNQLDEKLQIWRIKSYRQFCLLWSKKSPNKRHRNDEKQATDRKAGWLNYWFPKSGQIQLKQLEACLESTPAPSITKKYFSFSIQQIKIAISIRSLAGKQPFINILSYNNQIETTKTPIGDQKKSIGSEIEYQKYTRIVVNKMMVQYDKYAGHHQDHFYLMNQLANQIKIKNRSNQNDEADDNASFDEFEDIQNFLQCSITANETNIRVQPIVIRLNEDTLQKLSVYKFERIHNTFQNAEKLILEQNFFEQGQNKKKKKQLSLKTSVYIKIPENMCEKQSEQIDLALQNIQYKKGIEEDRLTVDSVVLSAVLNMSNQEQMSSNHSNMNNTHQDNILHVQHYESVELIRTKIGMKKDSQQRTNWSINPIKISFSSIYHLKQLIRLIAKLKPKQKAKKPLYKLKNLRRKQSIGQQFIDACENLNEHLMRSATLSENTRHEKYIIKQKKNKITKIRLQGLKAIVQGTEIELSQTTISLFEFRQHKQLIANTEQKELSIRIYNIKNSIKNIKEINKELQRMFQLKGSNEMMVAAEKSQPELEGDTVEISGLNIYLEIYYHQDIKISAEVTNISFEVKRDRKITIDLTVGIAYFQYPQIKDKKINKFKSMRKEEQDKHIKEYVVQPFKIAYLHQKKYNKDEKSIKISSLNFNIKPNLFVELGMLFDQLNTPQILRIQIINATANIINLSTTGNIYKEYKPHHIAISSSTNCDIIIFGRKEVLTLSADAGTEQVKLTEKISLIKALNTEYIYQIESNVRITNRQERTIWVRVITNQGMAKLRKNSMKDGLITFEHLSNAQIDRSVGEDDNFNNKVVTNHLKRSSSLNQRFANKQEDSEKDEDQHEIEKMDIQIKKVSITRSAKQSHKSKEDINLKQSQKSQKSSQEPISKKQSNKSMADKTKLNSHEILYQPIAPEHTIQILLNSQDYYIEIIEYDTKGQIHEKYQPFKIKQILRHNNQFLLHSYIFESWGNNEDEREISSSLIVATNVTEHSESNPIPIFNIQVLSPIVMVNKIPSPFQFRLNKEEVDMLEIINSAGRSIRKRSFQVVDLQNIQSFNICRINKMMYKEISETEIMVGQYSKNFRLDHIIEKLKQNKDDIDIRIIDLLCLNNGKHEIQMGIQIRILKHIMKITIFPQFIFINMTEIPIKLQIQEQNYTYPQIQLNPLAKKTQYKQYIKISNEKLANPKALQQLFQEFTNNINIFTGSFDEDIIRKIRYGSKQSFIHSNIYNTYQDTENDSKTRQKQILYNNSIKLVYRKIRIDDKPINMVLFMPSLFIINKSDWSFFIKGEGEKDKLKKIEKNSTEYMLINDTIAVQACEEYEEIAYNQWLKITLTTLGTIYYAKQMTASNGYESREYELRKKRLKKVPKLFFRIVMAKYEYGYQILIQESQYPPVTFISRCKSRIQIKQATETFIEEMEENQMAEYASKISHHVPKFSLLVVQHYQFRNYGEFFLNQPEKVLSGKIMLTIQEYKDKQIVIFQDYDQVIKKKNQSIIRNELLLEKLERLVVNISNIQVSILTKFNKELSCACLRGLEIQHESKNTKKYIKVNMDKLEIFSYNGLQPKYLFYSKPFTSPGVRKEMLSLFKRKGQAQFPNLQASQMLGNSIINRSLIYSMNNQQAPPNPPPTVQQQQQILSLDIVIDYHKHATILQKCKVTISELVIVINANTLIDYLKYYYKDICELSDLLRKHELGRKILGSISGIFSSKKANDSNEHHDIEQSKPSLSRKNSVSINNIGNTLMKKNKSTDSTRSPRKQHHEHHHHSQPAGPGNQVNIMHRGFIIENFVWDGLKVAIKFENLDNLQYFMNNKEIKYLIKFITWVGDLRPIEFSPTQVEYQKYTIAKLLQLIDLNKLIRQLYQTFLQYPLQQLYHIISFITRFIGINQQEQNNEQWHTFKRLGKSILNISKKIFSANTNNATYFVNENGELVENKFYLDQFMEDNVNNNNILSKIMGFKYQQWRYNQEIKQNKLNIKALRLERYSPSRTLLPYQSFKSRIQTAINDYCGNKIFRQIKHITQINKENIIGLTEDWFVLYRIEKQQWIVARPEDVLQLYIEKNNNKSKSAFSTGGQKRLIVALVIEKEKNKDSGKIQRFAFEDLSITKTDIEAIEEKLAGMRLANVY